MHVVTVYPLAKGVRAQELQYYYSQPINRGVLVTVPFGNREITAVVAESSSAENQKLAIRSADYELKPIKLIHDQVFFAQFLAACEQFADFSGVTTGATLRALTPAVIRNNPGEVPTINCDFLQPNVSAPPASIIQDTTNKQLEYIHSLVQTTHRDNRSVFICAPTIADCEWLADKTDTQPVIQLHSELTKRELITNWTKAVKGGGPALIIGTPTFLSVPHSELGQIILTAESNSAYKMNNRPFLDKAQFARQLADTYKQPCTLSDRALTTTTLWEFNNNELTSQFKPTFHYHQDITTDLIDMTELADTSDSGVRVFSPDLAQALRSAITQNEQALLFVARSGRRPFTACRDCGETITCPQCGLPLLLKEQDDERVFVCRTCREQFSAQRRCDNCDSWHLQPLGIGIDFVIDILESQLEAPVYQIDGNNTQSQEAVQDTLTSFFSDPGSVLVTTTLGLHHLDQSVAVSGVVTADSLLAIPDLSVSHELFTRLLTMREYTKSQMLIQTRSNQTAIFQQALDGDIEGFHADQITQRKQFSYPPFSYLIKLQISETQSRTQKLLQTVKQKLSDYQLQIYPDRTSNGINILIRIDRDNWVDQQLVEILRDLPLAVSVNAHPKSLL